MALYDEPTADLVTPTNSSSEGFLLPESVCPDVETTPDYVNQAPLRELRRLEGVSFRDAESGERLDAPPDALIRIGNNCVQITARVAAALNLIQAATRIVPFGYDAGYLIPAEGGANVAHVYEFEATGTGRFVTLHYGASDPDPAHLKSTGVGPGSEWSIRPGDFLGDGRGDGRMVMISDVSYGSTGTEHTVRLALVGAVDVRRYGRAWVVKMDKTPTLDLAQLAPLSGERQTPSRCKHAICVSHSAFSSFKAAYPSEHVCAGIAGDWFCEKVWDSNTDLSDFQSFPCNNRACPNYEPLHQIDTRTTYQQQNALLFNKGWYVRQLAAGLSGASNLRHGLQHGYSGLFELLGLGEIQYGGLYTARKTYDGLGRVKAVWPDTVEGKRVYLDWAEWQSKLESEGLPPTDAVGVFDHVAQPYTLHRNDLDDSQNWADFPRGDIESAIGLRCLGSIGRSELASVNDGPPPQRPKSRKHTSQLFTSAGGSFSSESTTLEIFPSLQVTRGWEYNAAWTLPAFGGDASAGSGKASATVKSAVAGDFLNGEFTPRFHGTHLKLEFALRSVSIPRVFTDTFPNTNIWDTAKIGGSVVHPKMVDCLTFVDSPDTIGGGRGKACPGDRLDVAGFAATVVYAEAYAGGSDPDAVAPHPDAIGVPDSIREVYAKRDVVVVELDAVNEGMLSAGVVGEVATISHGCVIPPATHSNVNLWLVDAVSNTKTWLHENTDFKIDRPRGVIYAKLSLNTSHSYGLHVTLTKYDRRPTQTVEDARSLLTFLEHVLDNGWIQGGGFSGGFGVRLETPSGGDFGMFAPDVPSDFFDRDAFSWAKDDGVEALHDVPASFKAFDWVGTHVFSMGSYVGWDLGEYMGPFDVFAVGVDNEFPFVALTNTLPLGSEYIKRAMVNVTLANCTVSTGLDERGAVNGEEFMEIHNTTNPDAFEGNLQLVRMRRQADDSVTWSALGLSTSFSFTRFGESDDVRYVGHANVTQLARRVADAPEIDGDLYGFVLTMGDQEMLPSFRSVFDATCHTWAYTKTDPLNYVQQIDTTFVTFQSVAFDGLMVQLDKGAVLNAAPRLHVGSTGSTNIPQLREVPI